MKIKKWLICLVLLLSICCAGIVFGCEKSEDPNIKASFEDQKFFMYGTTADYCIDSEKEYELFVWYNILYQKADVEFYKNFNSVYSVETLTKRAINSYPEYNGVNSLSSYSGLVKGKTYITLKDVTYYLDKDRIEDAPISKTIGGFGSSKYTYDNYTLTRTAMGTTTTIDTLNTTDSDFATEFEEDVNQRTFPIDDREGIEVFNTEQLFMVATNGKKPILKEEPSVVNTVYANARTILSQINTDDMTDYEKVKNIYDYVIGHNIYNNVIISYMSTTKDYSQNTYGNYSDFYLEGILYNLNKQISVCDGISKAFALLCNIEGIEAIKINGEVNSGNGYGDHAWNKVKIGDKWYCVDITWADYLYNDPDDDTKTLQCEAATHTYFLVSDETLRATADRTEIWPVNSPETSEYDYYTVTELISPTDETKKQSLLVDNRQDLRKLIAIADELQMSAIEILFSADYYDAMDGINNNLESGRIEYGTEDVIEVTTLYNSVNEYYYATFEYNEEQYVIKKETLSPDSWGVFKTLYLNGISVEYTKVDDLDNNTFVIDDITFTYYPYQKISDGDLFRAELGNNTPSVRRISYVLYDNFLIVWLGRYPVVEGEE